MPVNTESLNRKLFNVLSRYKPKPLDVDGDQAEIEDVADVFKFTFSKDGKDYGQVYATIDDKHRLNLYYDDSVTECPSEPTPGLDYNDSWNGFLEFMKQWAFRNRLKWNPDNNKDHLVRDMARRKYMKKQENISEGYYPMGKKASYSDAIPSVKIVIEHTRQIEEGEQRYRNVNRIFLENQAGERFLLDTKQPGIARVYARHIAEGGVPNDERWNHIKGLCEEYKKMAGFVRATRGGQFNESAQKLVESGIAHYQSLRESLSKMTGKRGYNAYFESWTPPLMEDDSDTSNLNELFVEESLDPRIESVMPILSKLQKKVSEMKEVDALAEWADSLVEGGGGPEASEEPEEGLVEEESLTSNNPVGIPEGEEDDLEEGIIDTIKKGVKKGLEKVGHGSDEELLKDLQKKAGIPAHAQHGKPAMAKTNEEGVAEGWDPDTTRLEQDVRDALENGDDYTAKQYAKMAPTPEAKKYLLNIIKQAMYIDDLGGETDWKGVAEDLDANQKRVGQLGPTEKVKNNNIGKLVGANENFINTVDQAVVTEMDKESAPGRDSDYKLGQGKEYTGKPSKAKDVAKDAGKILGKAMKSTHDKPVKEGQEDLDAMLRILRK